jgi:hypothetical protein
MKSSGYEVFQPMLDANRDAINSGEPVMLEIKEYATISRKLVKAKVAKSKDQLENPEELWVMGPTEVLYPDPWAIEIIEELNDDEVQLEYPQSEGAIGLYSYAGAQKEEEG